jgi:YidC/Oxa1 family membrane protein insertase
MEYRNLILAVGLSISILLAFNYFFPPTELPPSVTEIGKMPGDIMADVSAPTAGEGGDPSALPQAPDRPPVLPGVAAPSSEKITEDEVEIQHAGRIRVESPKLRGSISLLGGRIDDLTLLDYRETLDPESPNVVLFKRSTSRHPYYATFGWVAEEKGVALPKLDTIWSADGQVLTPDTPVTLTWDNGEGLRFIRTFALDLNYMFSITQRVESTGGSVTLFPYAFISRSGTPEVTKFIILHEGLLGTFNGALEEIKYKDLKDDRELHESSTGGWIGITDKYWLAALVPDQNVKTEYRFTYRSEAGKDKYQVDFLGEAMQLEPGAGVETTSRLFAGAKVVRILDDYESNLGIEGFDRAVDFGWFYFLTKPIFYILDFFYGIIGNFGFAILLLTVIIKVLFFPLANKSYRAMGRMKKLAPDVERLREEFKDDRQRQSQEMMKLYKREGTNPFSGCLPMLVQIPVFFSLYKVLFVTIEMRHAPFFGWIQDLSAPDPTSILNLFGLLPAWDLPPQLAFFSFLSIGIWPIIMGGAMFVQQRITPQPADQTQAKIMMFLPLIFTFLLAKFPAGLVIYWACNNILTVAQQWLIMRRELTNPSKPPKAAKS